MKEFILTVKQVVCLHCLHQIEVLHKFHRVNVETFERSSPNSWEMESMLQLKKINIVNIALFFFKPIMFFFTNYELPPRVDRIIPIVPPV